MQKATTRAKNKYNAKAYKTLTIRFKNDDNTIDLLKNFAKIMNRSTNEAARKILALYLKDAQKQLQF